VTQILEQTRAKGICIDLSTSSDLFLTSLVNIVSKGGLMSRDAFNINSWFLSSP
jgi:hypothetical protein